MRTVFRCIWPIRWGEASGWYTRDGGGRRPTSSARWSLPCEPTFGIHPAGCLAAIGPCIAGESYEVGREVADQFRNFGAGSNSGAATAVLPKDELAGKYTLNLRQVVFVQLLAAGLRAESIAVCDEDTFRNRRDLFSFRRDGAATGRMAAFLALPRPLNGREQMKQFGLIAGVLALIAALAVLNKGIGRNAQPDTDDDDGTSRRIPG